MFKVKENIYGVLKGGFLTGKSAFENWRIIVFVATLLLIVITSAHNVDKKVMKIAALNKKKRELRAEYVDTATILMQMKMESSIRKRVKKRGLKPSQNPPKKIKITYQKN